MNFEAFNYAEKRVRSLGTREWKLWFSDIEGWNDLSVTDQKQPNGLLPVPYKVRQPSLPDETANPRR
jgi:hypothetical protein